MKTIVTPSTDPQPSLRNHCHFNYYVMSLSPVAEMDGGRQSPPCRTHWGQELDAGYLAPPPVPSLTPAVPGRVEGRIPGSVSAVG